MLFLLDVTLFLEMQCRYSGDGRAIRPNTIRSPIARKHFPMELCGCAKVCSRDYFVQQYCFDSMRFVSFEHRWVVKKLPSYRTNRTCVPTNFSGVIPLSPIAAFRWGVAAFPKYSILFEKARVLLSCRAMEWIAMNLKGVSNQQNIILSLEDVVL